MKKHRFKKFLTDYAIWQDTTFPNQSVTSKLEHLKTEIDEVIEILESTDSTTGLYVENYLLRHEIADAFLLMFASARDLGFNFSDIKVVMAKKFEIIKNQEWAEPDKKGIIHRIK